MSITPLLTKFNFKNKLTVSLSVLFILVTLVLLNKAVFIITLPFIAWFIVLKPQKRAFLILTFFLGTAFFLLVSTATKDFGTVRLKLGFLINEPLTLVTFIRYWFYNFGLYTILIPIGCLLCPKKARRLILPLLAIFVYANIFQFSTDIINNHKFFNFFLSPTFPTTKNHQKIFLIFDFLILFLWRLIGVQVVHPKCLYESCLIIGKGNDIKHIFFCQRLFGS